jgi:hypothetical protein
MAWELGRPRTPARTSCCSQLARWLAEDRACRHLALGMAEILACIHLERGLPRLVHERHTCMQVKNYIQIKAYIWDNISYFFQFSFNIFKFECDCKLLQFFL